MNYNSSTSFPDVIGITGTPGTGKKTIGCKLAEQINYEFCNIAFFILVVLLLIVNYHIIRVRLYSKSSAFDEI